MGLCFMNISVVVPVYNEEGNVERLFNSIKNVCETNCYNYEIIFVNDGSTDNTEKICKLLMPLTLINLRKNFGQTAAMEAGIQVAVNDYIITMDGDGQNDPNDIPRMIEYLEAGSYDVVSGWRKNRKDPFFKKIVSRGANLLRKFIINDGIHDSGCSLKIYKRDCFQDLHIYGEMHRFIPALLKMKGYKIGEIVVNHNPRTSGVTKYNWKRTFKGFVDMVSIWFWNKYAVRPLHLLGGLGVLSLFLGALCGMWTVVLFFLDNDLSDNFQPIITIFFLITGLLLFLLGLISDMLSKLYYGSHIEKDFSIKDIIITKKEDEKIENLNDRTNSIFF